jgi:hypothetical protein
LCASFAGVSCDAAGQRTAAPAAAVPAAAADTSGRGAAPAYQVISVNGAGRITGRVTVTGHVRRDTVVFSSADARWCGATPRVSLVEGAGDRVAGAVVWIDDLRAGKPLPMMRRYDLTTARCAARPAVQAAVAGGMLDVRSRDPIAHRTRFLLGAATLDVVDENDAGQVVPTAAVLAHAGLVEVRCDLHAATHGWIRVFDQPYFTVTARDGSFHIDSIPPGTYHVAVWQPALGMRETTVQVKKGEAATVNVAMPAPR